MKAGNISIAMLRRMTVSAYNKVSLIYRERNSMDDIDGGLIFSQDYFFSLDDIYIF